MYTVCCMDTWFSDKYSSRIGKKIQQQIQQSYISCLQSSVHNNVQINHKRWAMVKSSFCHKSKGAQAPVVSLYLHPEERTLTTLTFLWNSYVWDFQKNTAPRTLHLSMMFGGISRSNIYIQCVAQISELSFVHESLWTARDFASNANITINTTDENWV